MSNEDFIAQLRARRTAHDTTELLAVASQPTASAHGGTIHVVSSDDLAERFAALLTTTPEAAAEATVEAPRKGSRKGSSEGVAKVKKERVARTTVTLDDVTNCWTALRAAKTVKHIDTIVETYRSLVKDSALMAMLANRTNADYDPTVYVRTAGEPLHKG